MSSPTGDPPYDSDEWTTHPGTPPPAPTPDVDEHGFRELHLSLGGWPVLIGWQCPTCSVLVPHVSDLPPDHPQPRDIHRHWHEEVDHGVTH